MVVAQLLFLEAEDADKEIKLYINSPGGTKGKRFALPNTQNMIRQPSGGIKAPAQTTDIEITARYMLKSRERLNRILAENTGQAIDRIAADTERDNYMDAAEALRYGMIDGIVERKG